MLGMLLHEAVFWRDRVEEKRHRELRGRRENPSLIPLRRLPGQDHGLSCGLSGLISNAALCGAVDDTDHGRGLRVRDDAHDRGDGKTKASDRAIWCMAVPL